MAVEAAAAASNPYALPIAIGLGGLGGLFGSNSVNKASRAQAEAQKYMADVLREINSRENIYSPGQISTQDALFPLYWGFLANSLGADPAWAQEQIKTVDESKLTAIPSDDELWAQAKKLYPSKYYPMRGDKTSPEAKASRESWVKQEKERLQAQREAEIAKNQTMTGEAQTAFGQGQESYNLMENFMKAQLDKQRGAEQSALDVAKQNAITEMIRTGRQMMGSGASGHVMGQIGGIEQEYLKQRPQLDTNRQLREQEWRVQNLQDALGKLGGMAYGQGVNNQPYTPPTPAAPIINTTIPNMFNQFANLATMYAFNRATSKNAPTSTGMFGYPSSMSA